METALKTETMPPGGIYLIGDTSLRDVLDILFRRQRQIVLFFLVVVSVVTAVTFLVQEVYQSEATVLIRVGRESVAIDPAVVGPTINLTQDRESEVNSELAILTSRYLAERVVDKIGPNRFLTRPDETPIQDDPLKDNWRAVRRKLRDLKRYGVELMIRFDVVSPRSDREEAITRVIEHLSVDMEKKSHIITLTFNAQEPTLAQDTLNSLLDFYLERHIEVHKAQGSPRFFEGQSEMLLKNLHQKEDELEGLCVKFNIASLDTQKTMLLGQMDSLQKEIDKETSQINGSRAKIAALEAFLQGRTATTETNRTTGKTNNAADTLKIRLTDLRLKEADLAARYSDDFRTLRDIREQIRMIEDAFKKEAETHTEVTTGIDTTYQAMELALATERAEIEAAAARKTSLINQMKEVRTALAAMMEQEMTIKRLERDVEILDKEYRQYRENLQRANISSALDIDKVANVSVVQPGTLSMKPVWPKKGITVLLGVFLGLFGGIGFAFFMEYLDDSLKTAEDVEKRLGLPVLASLSEKDFQACG